MATLTRGVTFGATETVTNTKLHNLVDLGSVSNIVDADCSPSMGLSDTKLSDITTGNKVRGTALGNLSSIPSSAGIIPYANIGNLGMSIASIPNASLLPITLTSWVDGAAMRNIQSMPSLAGQAPFYSVVSSIASGGYVGFNGGGTMVGVPAPQNTFRFISKTSPSAATNSGDISITNTNYYFVTVNITTLSSADAIGIRFNNNSSSVYGYIYRGFDTNATASNANADFAGAGSTSILTSSNMTTSATSPAQYYFYIYPQQGTGKTLVVGKAFGPVSTSIGYTDFFGVFSGASAAVTSFRLYTTGGNNMTGDINLYQITQA